MKIAIFLRNDKWKWIFKPHTSTWLLLRGWTTNEFAYNYKNYNSWGKKIKKNQLNTFDWSKNLLTNNLLVIFWKEKIKGKKTKKKAS